MINLFIYLITLFSITDMPSEELDSYLEYARFIKRSIITRTFDPRLISSGAADSEAAQNHYLQSFNHTVNMYA